MNGIMKRSFGGDDMGVMMQYFESNIKPEQNLWNQLADDAYHLSQLGITAVWMPPAFKGASGIRDIGYGLYDLYDLGQFHQKGTVRTKYGYKDEFIQAIESCHQNNIHVYPDIVLNHKMGSDNVNVSYGQMVSSSNRNKVTQKRRKLLVPTQFNFYDRHNMYSSFKWTQDHFSGVDYDFFSHKRGIYLLHGHQWSNHVSQEFGNFDYLMGANIDHNQEDVKEELMRFGDWFVDTVHPDGFRLDALKHIDYQFYKDWLWHMRQKQDYFVVGEYWSGIVEELEEYLSNVDYCMSLFDVPLHYHFYECSRNRDTYDLRNLFKDTLVQRNPVHAVTFVDNHDTQPQKGLASYVYKWFKPMAYACILLREQGYPCVFYGDYYGIHYSKAIPIHDELDGLLYVRRNFCYGWQNDYFEDDYQMGWTREGGMACLFSIRQDGDKYMYVGEPFNNCFFYDIYNPHHRVYIDNGWGRFTCKANHLSVFVLE